MTLNYKKSQSTVCPELIDTTSSKFATYIRQNIVEKETTDDVTGETYTYYEYEEAKLSKEEYEQYKEELNSTETLESIEELRAENASLKEEIELLSVCVLELGELLNGIVEEK